MHTVPRRNKYFKEELRAYREDIRGWLHGDTCDAIDVYEPSRLSFYRKVLMSEAVKALRSSTLPLITIYADDAKVIR